MTFATDGPSLDASLLRGPTWGLAASFGLHAALIALLVIGAPGPLPVPPPVFGIAVDLISPAEFAVMTAPVIAPAPEPLAVESAPLALPEPDRVAPDVTPATPVPAAPAGPIRATEFYAGELLAEPASAGLVRGLRATESRERLVQLCGIEAMEQIRRARPEFDPDIVVAYAFAETEIRDGALVAEGAAFRSRREWYGLRFTCTGAGGLSVGGFEFTIGGFIPHEDWETHYLTAEEAHE